MDESWRRRLVFRRRTKHERKRLIRNFIDIDILQVCQMSNGCVEKKRKDMC